MYLLDYSLDNLSLMALTISTGFVVDDAIVVIENISRFLEQGMRPLQAALLGAQEIGFTVISMSVSLVAVFIPLLMMGGVVGRLFREFAVRSVGGDRRLARRFADDHPDDVRAHAAPTQDPRLALPAERAMLQPDRVDVRMDSDTGAAASRDHAGRSLRDHRAQRLSVHSRSEGILPAAGQRAHDGRHSGRPGHFVSRRCRSVCKR